MDTRFATIAALGAANHGVVSSADLRAAGVNRWLRDAWVERGQLWSSGSRSFVVAGAPATWHRNLAVATADLSGRGWLAGRTAARLHGLDGFGQSVEVEVIVPRSKRSVVVDARVGSTSRPIGGGDTIVVDGFRCLTAERLVLDSPLFGFSVAETENAIDSAIRLRKVSEQRLRTAVVTRHRRGSMAAAPCSRRWSTPVARAGWSVGYSRWCVAPGFPGPRCAKSTATARES